MVERIQVLVADDFQRSARYAANLVSQLLKNKPRARIGAATGSTMVPVYRAIASSYAEGELSLANADVFQIDEYYPIDPWHPRSYRNFLRTHLVEVTDLPASSLHVPNGATSEPSLTCENWDRRLRQQSIDVQFLGIGVEGHIAFVEARPEGGNELRRSRTMLIDLAESTIHENSRFFSAEESQPVQGLTVGVGTLVDLVDHFILVASGSKKSLALARALLDDVDDRCPASYLREARGQLTVLTDRAAVQELVRRLRNSGQQSPEIHIQELDSA